LKKDYDGALKLLDSILRDAADKSLPRLFQAKVYYFQKKYQQAEESARLALNEDPQLLDGWQLLLNIAAEQKDYPAMKQSLLKLRQALPAREFARFVDDQIAMMASANN
jgi:tetratricopeptide (TPR) repeat protein